MVISFQNRIKKDYRALIGKTIAALSEAEKISDGYEIFLSALTEKQIREVNRLTRGKDEVTDVLSFPCNGTGLKAQGTGADALTINPETGNILLGEINICLKRAEEQAEEYGHTSNREIAYLALHGALHILGYDHMTETDKKVMRKKEEEILSRAQVKGNRDESDPSASAPCSLNPDTFKSGFAAVIGKPNSGKSTLINALVGAKVSIVSPKPQTTRNKISGVLTGEDYQIIFEDTPGSVKAKSKLNEYMIKSIDGAVKGCDITVYVADVTQGTRGVDAESVRKSIKTKKPFIAAVNKTDIVPPPEILPVIKELADLGAEHIIPVSAKTGEGLDVLLKKIKGFLEDGAQYYPEDVKTDKTKVFAAAEIIREKALILYRDEIPHGLGVSIEKFEVTGHRSQVTNDDKLTKIEAVIYCEKDSHKPIILGRNGATIKLLGTRARKDLETLIGNKVYLNLWVKVKEDWRDSDFYLRELGYKE